VKGKVSYQEKMYGIVVIRPGGDRRLFGRIRRSSKGDVYTIWAEDQSPRNLAKGSNPHASYHADGRLHSKSYDRAAIIRRLQVPNQQFRGNQPIEATNADRAISPTLPPLTGSFDDLFEIPLDLISGKMNQSIAVDVIEPGGEPIRVTGKDKVLVEKVFKDEAPWIVVSFVETPDMP
jgi:hypothetical protein